MRRAIFLSLFSATCLAAQPAEEAVNKELKHFQGKWTLVAGQGFDGNPWSVDRKSMVIKGNKFTLIENDKEVVEGTFTVDPTKKIKTIDINVTKPVNWKMLGIYQIDGEMRKSCFAEKGQPRPDDFRKEAGFMFLKWKRAK